ncbi:MAG: septum formation inhibitor Maf [Flavobacteriales bacterium]|nr:septum formation inhibitor Maf [Flavobacteriales bacterium]
MLQRSIYFIVGISVLTWLGCNSSGTESDHKSEIASRQLPEPFGDYWYQSKAEINRYDLYQERYGEIRNGDAILIFVTEDFLPGKQVKADDFRNPDAKKVMKLNHIRKFVTGIYDYSVMTSVFVPLYTMEGAWKISTSSQEWCGHSWIQLNKQNGRWAVEGHSYFEKEADTSYTLPDAWTEDELMIWARLDPEQLPTGPIDMIPSALGSRLYHHPSSINHAEASWEESLGDTLVYQVDFTEQKHKVILYIQKAFPHQIWGWDESPVGKSDQPELYTRARLRQTILEPYWQQNAVKDSVERVRLMM